MPPPMHKFSQRLNHVGVIARIATWPAWEQRPGVPAPHPIIVVKELGNRRFIALPITHSRDLSLRAVPIRANVCINAGKPHGPIDPFPDVSWISVITTDGDTAGGVVEIYDPDSLAFVNPNYHLPVKYSHAVDLGPAWPAIREKIRNEVERGRGQR